MQKVLNILYPAALLVLVVILFGRSGCDHDAHIVVQSDTAMLRKVHGIVEAYNKSTVLETQGQLKLLIAGNDSLKKMVSEFKRVQNTLVIRQEMRIRDSIRFKDGDSIPCTFQPIEVEKKTPFYSLSAHITNKALFIDDIFILNKQSIVLGDKKTSFWGHTERQVSVVNSNPLVNTQSIQNITIKEKRKWYEQPLIVAPGGFIVGTAIIQTVKSFLIKK